MEFIPKDPDYALRVKESFDRQSFMSYIGAELAEITPGYCEIHLKYNKNLMQQHGFFHAGVISTIADNSSGYAAYSLMESGSSILTVEFKINLLVPADGNLLIGKSNVLKNGKTLTICRSEIFIVKDKAANLCAASQSTLIEMKNRKDY